MSHVYQDTTNLAKCHDYAYISYKDQSAQLVQLKWFTGREYRVETVKDGRTVWLKCALEGAREDDWDMWSNAFLPPCVVCLDESPTQSVTFRCACTAPCVCVVCSARVIRCPICRNNGRSEYSAIVVRHLRESVSSRTVMSHVVAITLTNGEVTLCASDSDTVGTLKQKIKDKVGISSDQQRLIFGSRQLDDRRTLGSYSLFDGARIALILRLRGD